MHPGFLTMLSSKWYVSSHVCMRILIWKQKTEPLRFHPYCFYLLIDTLLINNKPFHVQKYKGVCLLTRNSFDLTIIMNGDYLKLGLLSSEVHVRKLKLWTKQWAKPTPK